MSERPFKRESNGGFERGFSQGNGRGAVRETHQTTSESEQRDRQEEEWSIPASVERRDDSPVKRGSPHRTPPTPAPSEDKLFTDCSSLESPHARTSPQSVPVRETGQNINQPDNQTTQHGSEPAQTGATGNAHHDDINVYMHVDFSFCLYYHKELNFSRTEQFFLLNTSFRQSS